MKRSWTIVLVAAIGAAACTDSAKKENVEPGTPNDALKATVLSPDTANHALSAASPDGRRIAYWSASANGWELRIAQADLSNARVLASATDYNEPLLWSPDGKHIAYASNAAGVMDVWTVSPDSGAPTRITSAPGVEIPLQWHPQGNRLAYAAIGADGVVHSMVATLGGSGAPAAMLAEKRSSFAYWSPDGSRIAYQLMDGRGTTLWVADSAGGHARQLTSEGKESFEGWGTPWSPDGRELLYVSRRSGTGDVWAVPVDSGTPRQLTKEASDDVSPVWSPDGKHIAFVSDRERQIDVWIVPAAGGASVRVTNDEAPEKHVQWMGGSSRLAYETGRGVSQLVEIDAATASERALTPDSIEVNAFDISPDGKTVVYGASLRGGVGELRVMPRAGGASRTLVPGPSMNSEPSFSPDGKQVAFISNRGGSGDTWVIDTAGGSPRQLTSWADEETDAEWSADSKSLYVMSVNGGGAFYDVYRVSRDGGAPEQLTKTANIQNIEPSRGNNALYVTAFGSKPGQVILGQLMPNGTMKTLWDKSNVTGLSHHRISPSGDSLAVQIEKAGGNFASVILSASSGTVTPILQRGDIAGAWSPDGTRIVYYSGTPSADLGILTLKDGTTKPLTKTAANEGNAMWTPDSKSIVVQRSAPRRRIAVVDVSALVSAQQTGSSKR